jgi:hypothetical protein
VESVGVRKADNCAAISFFWQWRLQSSGAEDNFESCLRNTKSQYEAFHSSRLSSDARLLMADTQRASLNNQNNINQWK